MNKKMSAVFVDCTPDIAPLLSKQIVELAPSTHIYNTEPLNEDELIDRLQPYAIAVVYMAFLSEKVLVSCPKLKSVVYLSTGLATHVDMEAASRLGIDIHGIKGYGDRAVAEHTIALMFAAARKIGFMDRAVRDGSWSLQRGFEVESRTFGVIGLGGIGIEVARIANALGMRVIGWNRTKIEPCVPCHILDVDELIGESDVISLHLTLCDETENFIDKRRIDLIKKGSILINTARAQLVNEAALLDALNADQFFAALDVFHEEPPKPDSSICTSRNVLLSSHSGWYTGEAIARLLVLGFKKLTHEVKRLDPDI